MKQHDLAIPEAISKTGTAGTPQLLYVSSWEQTTKALPRSLHNHPDFVEFTFVLAGQGVCELDGVFYPIAKGDLIVYNCGVLHDEFVDPRPLSLVSIAANGIQVPGLPENCLLRKGTIPVFPLGARAAVYHNLVTLLTEEVKHPNTRRSLISQSLFLALFYMTLDSIDAYYHKPCSSANATTGLGHKIRAYVDQHVTEDLSVSSIASQFQISTSYLARVFKHTTGCPLSKYIIRRRLGEAQTLLLNSTLPISEIAIQAGYPNQSYFTKLFTQSYGVSPLQYRKMSSERLINIEKTRDSFHHSEKK